MDIFLPATLPARLLAAALDYILVSGLFIALSQLSPLAFPDGVLSVLSGALYFTLSHSWIGKGQTIGKSLLGLKVIQRGPLARPLSFARSFLRYLSSFGFLILVAELPPLFYRANAWVASSWQLEFHMLLAFSWFFALCLSTLLDPLHRGLHDLLAHSLVVRPESSEREIRLPEAIPRRVFLGSAFGAAVAVLPWWLGIERPPAVEQIMRARYVLEQKLDIRVLNAQLIQDEVLIEALLLHADPLRGKEGQKTFLSSAEDLLRTSGAMPSKAPRIRFRLYADPGEEPLTKSGEPLEVFTESATLTPLS